MKTSLRFVMPALLLYAVLRGSQQASAQSPPPSGLPRDLHVPSSGSLLQSNPILNTPADPRAADGPKIEGERPAAQPSPPDGDRIRVARIEIDGAPDDLKRQVDAVVARYRDREMTLPDLRNVAVQVTEVLLDHGESLSYAYVPPQETVDDVVRLRILRGHVESIQLQTNRSLVKDRVLRAYLQRGLSSSGDLKLAQDQLTRASDLPGVGTVTPVLSAGQAPGATALSVNIDAGPRVEGAVVTDNAGSGSAGRNRVGALMNVNSPLGLGDRFQLVAYGAPDFLQFDHDSDGGYTVIGRASYDLPVGSRGARAGVAVSRVNYTLGGPYRDLSDGYATVYSVYSSYALAHTPSLNLNINANLDYKRMSDSLFDRPNRRCAQALTVQLAGDKQSRLFGLPNMLQYSIGTTLGSVRHGDDWKGAKTRGKYIKTTQSAKLTQGLRKGIYLALSVDAQQTSRNLDGSEKMVLGGPNAVRAYGNDAVSADSGYVASANLNVAVPKIAGITAQLFYDRAQASVQKFARRRRDVTLAGYGVGVNYAIGKRAALNLSYAMRAGGEPSLDDQHKATIWASTVVRF
jgi:hemolysin activation/secretion protein